MHSGVLTNQRNECLCVYLCTPNQIFLKMVLSWVLMTALFISAQCLSSRESSCEGERLSFPMGVAFSFSLFYVCILSKVARNQNSNTLNTLHESQLPLYSRNGSGAQDYQTYGTEPPPPYEIIPSS